MGMGSKLQNWRTTIAGLISALAGFVLFSPELFVHWEVELAKYLMAGGIGALGLLSKDSSTHSTVDQVEKAQMQAELKEGPVRTGVTIDGR